MCRFYGSIITKGICVLQKFSICAVIHEGASKKMLLALILILCMEKESWHCLNRSRLCRAEIEVA